MKNSTNSEQKLQDLSNFTPELQQKVQAMREGGKILVSIFKRVREMTKIGVNELEIDQEVEKMIKNAGAIVAYKEKIVGFPNAICISVNDELIHGVPRDYCYEDGDKISYDLTIGYKGYYVDSAFSMTVGENVSATTKRLLSTTESALYEGIEQVRAGVRLGTVGNAVEKVIKAGKFGLIENYVGHGIGKKMHEAPEVPNYGRPGTGCELKVGDTICIEPMASAGKPASFISSEDDWTVILKDGSIGAHFEHTVLVLEDGYEILTR